MYQIIKPIIKVFKCNFKILFLAFYKLFLNLSNFFNSFTDEPYCISVFFPCSYTFLNSLNTNTPKLHNMVHLRGFLIKIFGVL